jgi:ATP/maltotriose-dependent transcriptional regulator MalT
MEVTATSGTDPLAAGRAALERAAWAEALDHFEAAVAATDGAEAWEGVGMAAWWLGDQATTFSARERAYRAYRAANDAVGAARMAQWVASDNLDFRGDFDVAAVWARRGLELLADHGPCSEEGYLTLTQADIALQGASDPETAQRHARHALDLARTIDDVGVEIVALAILGSALIAASDTEEGLRCLDESSALAVGEDVPEAGAAGWALCHTVAACACVGEFRRASQWCRALHTWCELWQARHFFGICRMAYGDVLVAGGEWGSAEEELLSAVQDLSTTRPALAAPAAVRLGVLRVRQGQLAEARALYEQALPFPGAILALGELDLADGDATGAADAAERVLRRLGDASVLDRLPALELLARARAEQGDADAARAAADRVDTDAERLATPYMRGRGRLVRAHVFAETGEPDLARQCAEDAIDLFGTCSAPYEAAQARLVLSAALKQLGRADRAEAEANAARAAFTTLGAQGELRRTGPDALSPRETDILRLVATGMSDPEIADRLFLSRHTVHRHIANIRTKLGVPSRAAAVAYATRNELF